MITDPISDYIIRIKNASLARHLFAEIPFSKIKREMTSILYDQGFISSYKICDPDKDRKFPTIKVALKYDVLTKSPVISEFKRISKPGLRKYASVPDIPEYMNGLGTCILSTSKGLLTSTQARKQNVGGELICYIF